MTNPNLDVLITGAGPVGLMLATMLHQQGVESFRIVDRAPQPSEHSKALVVWTRTLELLEKAGLAQDLVERGLLVHGANIFADGKRLLHVSLDHIPSPFKAALSVPQSETERVLNQHLEACGHAVERRVELASFKLDDDGVDCVLRHPDGHDESVRARFLVGCDGAHSTVRHVLQMPFEGHTLTSAWALADIDIDGDLVEDEVCVFWDSEGIVALFPMGHGRFRIIVDLPPGAKTDEPPTVEAMQAIVDARVRRGWRLGTGHWLASFTINERKVRDYARGPVFLAGDAAHIHSPAGGQGMNTGMQDAANLAWKLGLVLRGEAPRALLDSYSVERSAVGEEVVGNADRLTSIATLRGPVKQHIRNQIVHFLGQIELVADKMTSQMTELSIAYHHSPILGQHSGPLTWVLARGIAPGHRVPDGPLRDAAGGQEIRLFDVLRTPRHVLLLFEGLHPDGDGTARLAGVARQATERYARQLETVLVSAEAPADWSGRVLLDEDGEIHRLFGAGQATAYVVRPDGYVGYRTQPVDAAALSEWLGTVFVPAPAAVAAGQGS